MIKTLYPLLKDCDNNIHFFVKEGKSDTFLAFEKLDEEFSSASVIKVPIAVAVLDYVERNNLTLDKIIEITSSNKVEFSVVSEQNLESSKVYDLLVWMIITSDNSATNVLIDLIGMDELNKYFHRIGLTKTKLQRKMMDFQKLNEGFDNVTSARDMANLFTRIYKKELLSLQYSNILIDILCRQRVHEGLKRYIVEDVRIAHKTGSLDTVCHDTGIVYHEVMDYIIGIFITEVKDIENSKRLIGRISKVVYDCFGSKEGV